MTLHAGPRRLAALSPDFALGDAVERLVRREDAERCIGEVRGAERALAQPQTLGV